MDVVELAKRLKELEDYSLTLSTCRLSTNQINVTVDPPAATGHAYNFDDCAIALTDALIKVTKDRIEEVKKQISEHMYPIKSV